MDISHKAHLGMRMEQLGIACLIFALMFAVSTWHAESSAILGLLSAAYLYAGASLGNRAAVQKIMLLKAELLNKEEELNIFRGVKNE
jgi:hypothetical protein